MADLTDYDITRLCARASELYEMVPSRWTPEDGLWCAQDGATDSKPFDYNPLKDDAQAMALVKRFVLDIEAPFEGQPEWIVAHEDGAGPSRDLNRAICLCVARMEQAREGGR